jgi:hypothetical protein
MGGIGSAVLGRLADQTTLGISDCEMRIAEWRLAKLKKL